VSDYGDLSRVEVLWRWGALALAASTGLLARLGWRLFNVAELPPCDPEQRVQWARKRRWIAISELSAIPAFATGWIAAESAWQLSTATVVLGSMASGALGFGFLLHALQVFVARKVGG
jgi:hypothetical protein